MGWRVVEDPYRDVDWDHCEFVHSMSHQHGGGAWTDSERQPDNEFYAMGFRHLAISNYYPSQPVYPLGEDFTRSHPDAIACPNAEHHSFTDIGMHMCALGSYYTTGYGQSVDAHRRASSPLHASFHRLHPFSEAEPWLGVYRLDIGLVPKRGAAAADAAARLTVRGAEECDQRTFAVKGSGRVQDRLVAAGARPLYFRAVDSVIKTCLEFDETTTDVVQYRLMQGTNRPFRQAIAEALDGTRRRADGTPVEGLLYRDGGGITINHPDGDCKQYIPVLDFDERVLGIEVWNHRRRFGCSRKFLHAYTLWDEISAQGRRCWGFFVKDHRRHGQGRNVLVLPRRDAQSTAARERAALQAYRKGSFFGLLGSMAVDEQGCLVEPYDGSSFCFQRIELKQDEQGFIVGLRVQVGMQAVDKRPNIQIRFVTEKGTVQTSSGSESSLYVQQDMFSGKRDSFVRVEAIAYPDRLENGRRLTHSELALMSVDAINLLHDYVTHATSAAADHRFDAAAGTPLSAVDMIFSQPIRLRCE